MKELKMQLNADLIEVGDVVVHPLDFKAHKVKSIQKSLAHADFLDLIFEEMPAFSLWKTSQISVIRPVQTNDT